MLYILLMSRGVLCVYTCICICICIYTYIDMYTDVHTSSAASDPCFVLNGAEVSSLLQRLGAAEISLAEERGAGLSGIMGASIKWRPQKRLQHTVIPVIRTPQKGH